LHQTEERTSFLKKRSKKLLQNALSPAGWAAATLRKFFGSFFKKEHLLDFPSLLPHCCAARQRRDLSKSGPVFVLIIRAGLRSCRPLFRA
jgi:hypothetical protein